MQLGSRQAQFGTVEAQLGVPETSVPEVEGLISVVEFESRTPSITHWEQH